MHSKTQLCREFIPFPSFYSHGIEHHFPTFSYRALHRFFSFAFHSEGDRGSPVGKRWYRGILGFLVIEFCVSDHSGLVQLCIFKRWPKIDPRHWIKSEGVDAPLTDWLKTHNFIKQTISSHVPMRSPFQTNLVLIRVTVVRRFDTSNFALLGGDPDKFDPTQTMI